MSETVKLYDLRERKYPHNRGDVFRSLQVFECWVCGGLTNRVVMGGYPGYGVRAVCPQAWECWHHELEEKLEWAAKPHPASYLAELQREIEDFRKSHAAEVKRDLEGEPDMNLKQGVTNTKGYKAGNPCGH